MIFTILTLREMMTKITQTYRSKIETIPLLAKTQCIIISLESFNLNWIQEGEVLGKKNLFTKIILYRKESVSNLLIVRVWLRMMVVLSINKKHYLLSKSLKMNRFSKNLRSESNSLIWLLVESLYWFLLCLFQGQYSVIQLSKMITIVSKLVFLW